MERNIKRITEEQIGTQYGYMSRVRELLGDRPRGVYMQTFGCQQNEADSERLCGMAEEMGYTVVSEPEDADLILVNTCAIREHAELKTLSIAGQFKHIKEKNPELLIGICGCMVSQEHRIDDIKNKYPYIDFLFGTSDNYRFPEILYDKLTRGKRQFFENGEEGTVAEGLPVHRFSDFKAWVSIMYGCNNFCTYCVVPYVRGRERSRRREDILEEVRGLAEAGYREITLLGQNVNSYGSDGVNGEGYDFADLLADICRIDGDFTVRFMTSHPKDVSEKLIDVIAENPKIARQFHLPLQSGSDRILREMNRHYDTARYLAAVDYMRRRIPDISLSTDIIVAFPGETEQDFEDTLSMLRRVRYDSIYSFIYSPRKGTRAAAMENQIPPEVSRERFARLLEVQNGISLELNREFEGRDVDVLVEGISKTDDSRLTGRMERGRLVHFAGDPSLTGSHVRVHIDRAETYALYGTLVCGEQLLRNRKKYYKHPKGNRKMTILEMANQLGHMLAETDVMKRSKAAEAAFQSDADLQADIAEYNAQTAAMQKAEDEASKGAIRERADALYGKIISYPTYVAYFEANNAVMKLMNEVNEEINFAITGEHGCGGNCSSCGGCH